MAFALLTLAGCGFLPEGAVDEPPDPVASCGMYLDVLGDCLDALDIEVTSALDASHCDAYAELTGEEAEAAAILLDCYTEAFAESDCATLDDLVEAAENAEACA